MDFHSFQFTWFKLLNVNWCVAGKFCTWAICNDVEPSELSCCVTMCCWFAFGFDASTIECVAPWFEATDTEIVCGCWMWICCVCSCCDVDDISSGSFFTVNVGKVDTLLLVPEKSIFQKKWINNRPKDTQKRRWKNCLIFFEINLLTLAFLFNAWLWKMS